MLWTALMDPDPVIIFEHAMLYNLEGELTADCRRGGHRPGGRAPNGKDITLITYGGSLGKTLQAAEQLAGKESTRR